MNQQIVPQQDKKTMSLGTVVIVCAVVLIAGYFGFTRLFGSQKGRSTVKNLPVPSPVSLSDTKVSPTVSSAVRWEEYTNKEYAFKHPQGLQSDTGAAGTGFESIRFQFMGPKQVGSGKTETSLFDGYSFTVTKLGSESQKTPSQWAEERRSTTQANCGGEGVVLSDVKKITVENGSGVQYSVKNCLGTDYTSSYLSNTNDVYEVIQFSVGEGVNKQRYEELTKLIFNGFRFLK